MAEDTARALGAGGGREAIMIAGKACHTRPLSAKELAEVEREALKAYRRSYVESYKENLDVIGGTHEMLLAQLEKVSRWDVSDLPAKFSFDPRKIVITPALKAWLVSTYEINIEKAGSDDYLKRIAAVALDTKMMESADYEKLTNSKPPKVKIGYVNWWITGCYDGIITFIWTCFSTSGVTRNEVASEIGRNPALMAELSHEIESLSAPRTDFGSAPPT